ncbi:uncharacterized protein LOC135485423 [Lineus longissimus]|uniref:uncharacterized protein LOC135485423 n=1 Tax=Lineus longissimus TaxID=88925 RepID=UPI00315D25FB
MKGAVARMLKWRTRQAQDGTLTVEDLENAEKCIIKHEQERFYRSEIMALNSGGVKGTSSIQRRDPYMEDGLLRVGGRLGKAASLTKEQKHQILIPRKSPVATRILEDLHRKVGHLGRNVVLSHLRAKYWIPRAINLIKKIVYRCVICRRYQAKAMQQKMADLHVDRVTGGEPPFTRTGMDYFGPFIIKIGRSEHKRYGVVFTCYAIRAIHIEVAHSLETSACIQAIRRFVCRRGAPTVMHSDNGTNLVGAEAELREAIKTWNKDQIVDYMRNKNITWQFNPPSATHFGGLWERQIRTIRKVMYSLLHEQTIKLDDEGLRTLFCEVECIVNNRPLTQASDDPQDLTPLTPNALLTLRLETPLPPGIFESRDCYSRKRWRRIQFLADNFWRRWYTEYLQTLQERRKWLRPSRNLKPGDIVLIIDNSAPRNSWLMAKVESVIKDGKGLVRSADVKTRYSSLTRPIAKLCLLLESA